MTDSPERKAEMQRLLKEIWEIEDQLGIRDDKITEKDEKGQEK